jgi:CheY-like chemotaxis protein
MSNTTEHLEHLKSEIASMEETKRQIKETAEAKLKELNALANKLRTVNETNGLGHLSRVLASSLSDKHVGVMVVGGDGRVLLFNAGIQRLLGMQLSESGYLSPGMGFGFFTEDKITPYPPDFLAWEKFQEERTDKLFVQHPKVPDGIWVQIRSLPLMDECSQKAGAVAIVNDITEHVKIESEVERISTALETQVSIIETAQAELQQLAQKLGKSKWDDAASAAAVKEDNKISSPQEAEELNKLILVVDDVPVNRKLLSIQLEKLGYSVEQADDGKPAVEKVKKTHYGLVLMDLDMPELDGFQATMAIREWDRETKQHTPVVAMTSYDREGDREKCLSHGMDDYLSKGVTKKRLQEVVDRCIRKKKSFSPAATALPKAEKLNKEAIAVDIKALHDNYGVAESAEIINLFTGTMRTLMGCLRFAVQDQDAKSVNHFAYSFKGPSATLGLISIANLTARITSDAEAGNWPQAQEALDLLESQCKQVMEQLAPMTASFEELSL